MDYAGTPAYFSPEIIKSKFYNEKVDIWAFGCVLYSLAALVHPFDADDINILTKNIVGKDVKPLPTYIFLYYI